MSIGIRRQKTQVHTMLLFKTPILKLKMQANEHNHHVIGL